MMPIYPRWFVFADDAGDPGAAGSPCFGYALLAIESRSLDAFNETRARFRVATNNYREAKRGALSSPGFQAAIRHALDLHQNAGVLFAATFITKGKYDGYWLAPKDGMPASPLFLRNYLIRKSLELLFDGRPQLRESTMELVTDRVMYTPAQVNNLQAYLNGVFNERERFNFPHVTNVTHADSRYVEALQVADHIARIAHRIAMKPEQALELGGEIQQFLRICSRVGSQQFVLHPDAARVL